MLGQQISVFFLCDSFILKWLLSWIKNSWFITFKTLVLIAEKIIVKFYCVSLSDDSWLSVFWPWQQDPVSEGGLDHSLYLFIQVIQVICLVVLYFIKLQKQTCTSVTISETCNTSKSICEIILGHAMYVVWFLLVQLQTVFRNSWENGGKHCVLPSFVFIQRCYRMLQEKNSIMEPVLL